MKVISHARALQSSPRGVCAAIGVFDGVHLGHQQIIRQTVADADHREALPVVVTFDRHPNAVVAPARVPPLIHPLTQRLRLIAALGVEAAWVIVFDDSFSRRSGEEFIRELVTGFGRLHSICVGNDFRFGHRRSGNVSLLQRLGQELGFTAHGLAAVALDKTIVSSTLIRQAIQHGNFDLAGQMLGRDYGLVGTVVEGDQLGRELGFPTANLDVAGLVLPPRGVYAVHAAVSGQNHRGVLNIGSRPTLGNPAPQLRAEIHLLDFSGNLYGQEATVTFVQKLRDEQKFPSLDALREQIGRDIRAAKRLF
jgi:riboflavin kinase/FMN adenylyltransferase